ncbi:hypothetical protein K3495_g12162 [Podosphaera aphanis]|nr:hypothetical protein K3495_g12162 [Podosphaera aphanis]
MVDITVDNNENSCHEIINVDYPETSINYRKCEERPLLHSVTSFNGGFQCGNDILRTQDALKAAYFARKMYRKKPKFSLPPFSLSSLKPLKFNGMISRYHLPITANGDYDLKGHISIALDKKFNVIGASLHKLRGGAKCRELTCVPPKIVGHVMGIMQNIAGYECPFGYFKASRILRQAMAVSFVFEDWRKISAQNDFFPRLYTGAYFPGVSEPLYYFPLVSGAEKPIPVYIILKRSLDVVGVLEMSRFGFVLCSEETQQHRPESFSKDHSNRYPKLLRRLH